MSTLNLRVLEHLRMGRDAYLLRLERPPWDWQAGQLVSLGGANPAEQRDYTIASGISDDCLDVLYRLIPHGAVTPHLRTLLPGQPLPVQGPYGRFLLRDPRRSALFCATGTGVAPCRAFLRSHPGLKLRLLHGVRFPEDLYFQEELRVRCDYTGCCSQSDALGAASRLTALLPHLEISCDTDIYLCGANEMIYEAEEILLNRGITRDRIFQEPYYYRAYDAD